MRTVLALACALVSILRPVTAIAAPPAPPPPIIWYQNEGGSCTVTCASLNTTCADETNNNDNPPFDEWPKTVWPTTEAQMEAISDEFDLGCTTYEQKTNIYAVVDPAAEDGSGFVVGTVVYGSGGVCECVAACKNHSECVAIVHNREQDPPYCKLKSVADTYERGDKDVLFPSLAPPAAQANGDPHLMLAHGGKADFRGTDKGIYNFLSAKNLSLNVMTEFADFYLHDTDHPRHKLVHGSFLTQAHVVAMTGGGRTVHASYWASKIGSLNIGWINATIDSQQAFSLGPHTTKVIDDVSLHMDYSSLHVTTGEWELAVTPQAVERSVAGPVRRIDVQMTPRVAESRLSVPPHGVIGQSWDGDNKAVFGKEDEFPVRGEYTTSAMAEGAIEGVTTDYLMSSPYATDFKYSRFGLAHASPRDVSGLTGRVKAAAPLASGGAGVMEKEMESSAGQVY